MKGQRKNFLLWETFFLNKWSEEREATDLDRVDSLSQYPKTYYQYASLLSRLAFGEDVLSEVEENKQNKVPLSSMEGSKNGREVAKIFDSSDKSNMEVILSYAL